MSVFDRLQRLDTRVLGRPKPASASAHRTLFFISLAVTSAGLIALGLTGDSIFLSAVGAPAVLLLGSGCRWYASARQGPR